MQDGSGEAVAKALADQLADAPSATRFANLLFAAAGTDVIARLGPRHMAEDARSAVALVEGRAAGTHRVAVRQRAEGHGPAATIVEAANDDMPFLLDSMLAEIQARGLSITVLLHPIMRVRRDATGGAVDIGALGDAAFAGVPSESFIAIHLEPALSNAAASELASALDLVLLQVRRAVTDWPAMLARLAGARATLAATQDGIAPAVKVETLAFLDWLKDSHFTFLGMRELRLDGPADTGDLVAVDGHGLGILSDPDMQVLRRGNEPATMTPEVRRFFFGPSPLIITKANTISAVHRRVHLDYIGIKIYGADTRPKGELRIVGLFTSRAYQESADAIPFVRHRVESVRTAMGYPPASHAGKALDNVLNTFPRDELFQIGNRQLAEWCAGILDLELRPRVRVFVRYDRFDRFASVLVYAPRERYNTQVREKIGALLTDVFGGRIAAFYPYFPDGPLVRTQFIVVREGSRSTLTTTDLETRIAELTRTFDDDLVAGIATSGANAATRTAIYGSAFPPSYADFFPADRALADIARLERLSPERPLAIDFHRAAGMAPNRVHAAVYRIGEPMRLSERVPALENLGFSVIDERTFRLTPRIDGSPREVALHDMELETADGLPFDLDARDGALEDAFLAVFGAKAENDAFNRLIVTSGLDWREAAVLRAYAAYLRQIGAPFGLRYIADTLRQHAGVARDLMELFHIRFNPDRSAEAKDRDAAETVVRTRIAGALASVPSLDEDRILRLVLGLIGATQRTNFFQLAADGSPPETIAFKFAAREIDSLPEPKPLHEIWVASPRVEGVHLRFAAVARGGIRWSDRAQDFRTEVLGLVKAQLVKNAVIVPSGAKGGFIPKLMPRAASRDETMKEGIAAYKIFISAMLDITDNLVDGAVLPPPRLVRHDGDDPYLVVAADKGTATFSDIANGLAEAHGFWLGDAFASGGSVGYDHKKMAITARGAWECVQRHFREMDWDIQTKPFRVMGVGDMSGDVFGNGMLLSPVIRLLAAFDHRDIFLDPDPDAGVSFAERRRLFDLPRSSWADYDKGKISAGGGVFSRASKSIALSPQVRATLGLTANAATPAELMRAILAAETDLLWFGGIGTYVRAASETDDQAGDRANDAVRVTGAQLRAKVVGEGANLGLTQRGRVEFAGRGGRINTDFIDNSAGVNSSDQEVNIKISVRPAVQDGRLTFAARNTLLASMTDDVARAVLVNNYQQAQALSLAERSSAADTGFLMRLMHVLEERRLLARGLEALPTDAQLAERLKAGRPLTRPELAVLLSFTKIMLTEDLLISKVPDGANARALLTAYFPPALRIGYPKDIAQHRLAREIIATAITNTLVNRGGTSLAVRLADETGRTTADAATAFMAADRVHGIEALWARVDALDNAISGAVQLELYATLQDFLQDQTLWFLRDGAVLGDLDATVAMHAAGLRELASVASNVEADPQGLTPDTRAARWIAASVPRDVAGAIANLDRSGQAPAITRLASDLKVPVTRVAKAYDVIGSAFQLSALTSKARTVPAGDYYDRLAIAQAIDALTATHDALTRQAVLAHAAGAVDGPQQWLETHEAAHAHAKSAISQIARSEGLTVSRLTVAAGQLRDLTAGQGS